MKKIKMNINKITNDIYEVYDFISEEEQLNILSLTKSISEEEWLKQNENYVSDFWFGKSIIIENDIMQIMNKRLKNIFSSNNNITQMNTINRHKINESMGTHTDHWLKDVDYIIRYGLVLYYNDDYLGGEIEYPDLNIIIKPKARSLIIHGGNIMHGTLPVLSNGIRYFSTAFVKETKDNPAILNKEIFGE
jgi:hypothetical protein